MSALPGGCKLPRQKKPTQPAETGRPEMASKFARRVKNHFVLRGPCEGTEGGIGDTTAVTHPKQVRIDELELPSDSEGPPTEREKQIPLTFLDEDDLLSNIKNHYDQDSFFRLILEESKHYRNFEVQDGYI